MADFNSNSLSELESSLREALKKEMSQKAKSIQRQAWEGTRQVMQMPPEIKTPETQKEYKETEKQLRDTVGALQTKEEAIEKRRLELEKKMKEKSKRVESQAKRLTELKKELECLEDPTKREISNLRKRIEVVDRELRPLKLSCQEKEKELKDAINRFNEKNAQKAELVGKLFDIVTESEKTRLAKLEELNKHLEAMEFHSSK